MGWAGRKRARVLVGFLAIVAALSVLVALLSRRRRDGTREVVTLAKSSPLPNKAASASAYPTPDESSPEPTRVTPAPSTSPPFQIPEGAKPNNLIIPVAGVRADQLHDTFSDSRAEGRVHDAIDIPAPQGTPVLAAADGMIVKLFHSERGGTTIYQLSSDKGFVYYYAHLDRYAEGLTEGQFAKQGQTIAYVGDSGNAGAGNYHLHFSIAVISDPRHYWQGVNINPYPLLKR